MSFCISPQRFTQLYPKPDTPFEPRPLRNLTEIAHFILSNILTGGNTHVGMEMVRNLMIHVRMLSTLNDSGSISDSFSSFEEEILGNRKLYFYYICFLQQYLA